MALGAFCDVLGGSWGLLEASWEPLGGLLGRSWDGFWQILAPLEQHLAGLGVLLGPLERKSGRGSSGSTILEAPRELPERKSGPGSSGSRIFSMVTWCYHDTVALQNKSTW